MADRQEAQRLLAQGLSLHQVAKRVGIDRKCIKRDLDRIGLGRTADEPAPEEPAPAPVPIQIPAPAEAHEVEVANETRVSFEEPPAPAEPHEVAPEIRISGDEPLAPVAVPIGSEPVEPLGSQPVEPLVVGPGSLASLSDVDKAVIMTSHRLTARLGALAFQAISALQAEVERLTLALAEAEEKLRQQEARLHTLQAQRARTPVAPVRPNLVDLHRRHAAELAALRAATAKRVQRLEEDVTLHKGRADVLTERALRFERQLSATERHLQALLLDQMPLAERRDLLRLLQGQLHPDFPDEPVKALPPPPGRLPAPRAPVGHPAGMLVAG